MKVVCLAGGVGGAKLAFGLMRVLPPEDLTVVVNTGDDFTHLGLRICPDLDTVTYTLAGLDNRETGWGLNLGTSFNVSLATLRVGAVYGRGIASYMNDGGMDMGPNVAVIQQPGTLVLVPSAVENTNASLPAPPVSLSLPAPPSSVSSPAPPVSLLASSLPVPTKLLDPVNTRRSTSEVSM